MAIEMGLAVIAPTRDIALTSEPMAPSGMCLEICPVKRAAVGMYLIKLRGQSSDNRPCGEHLLAAAGKAIRAAVWGRRSEGDVMWHRCDQWSKRRLQPAYIVQSVS